jgi:hypothetical protein
MRKIEKIYFYFPILGGVKYIFPCFKQARLSVFITSFSIIVLHRYYDTQHNDTQHNDIQHEGLICTTQHTRNLAEMMFSMHNNTMYRVSLS